MTEFDDLWKMESVRLALTEQIEFVGEINWNTVFQRAKFIYDKGYEHAIQGWESIWIENEQITETPREVLGPTRVCPKCGETIPSGWARHIYKKSGEKCGHVFEKKAA